MPVSVRNLSTGPASLIAALLDVVDPGHRPVVDPDAFGLDPNSFLLGALDDADTGQPPWVGLAWGAHLRYPTGHRMTYLHQLDVIEPYRRRGVATRLVETAMASARAAGSTRFWLSTGGHNEVARLLYERLEGESKPDGDVNYWWEIG